MRALAFVVLTAMAVNAQSDDLVSAAKRGDVAAVNRLLQAGADVNQPKFVSVGGNIGDATALMVASFQGSLEVVQALLAAKADVNATMSEKKNGETALTFAVQKGDVEVVRALLAANADVNHVSSNGNSPLYVAARTANLNMVKVLLTAKPKLNLQPEGGNTELMYAISNGRDPEVARLLMEAGADVNLSTDSGITALMLAAQRDVAMVQRLLAAGPEVNYRWCSGLANPPRPAGLAFPWDRVNSTALAIASSLGKVEIVQALLGAKADVNLAQCDGKTPLMLALENEHQAVAEVLRSAGAK